MSVKSTAILDFLLKNLQKLINLIMQSYLFITSELIFILKQIFCLPKKSLDNYFFRWFTCKSFFSRFSVLSSCDMWSSNHFSISSRFPCFSESSFFRVKIFQGPGLSESRFLRVRVQGLGLGSRVQDPGPGFGSRFQNQSFNHQCDTLNGC